MESRGFLWQFGNPLGWGALVLDISFRKGHQLV